MMTFKIQTDLIQSDLSIKNFSKNNAEVFTKDYVDFLNASGWKLERKLPSNRNQYSDLLEDTEWNSQVSSLKSSIHYRRDLDALS